MYICVVQQTSAVICGSLGGLICCVSVSVSASLVARPGVEVLFFF